MKKRVISVVLVLVLSLSFASCQKMSIQEISKIEALASNWINNDEMMQHYILAKLFLRAGGYVVITDGIEIEQASVRSDDSTGPTIFIYTLKNLYHTIIPQRYIGHSKMIQICAGQQLQDRADTVHIFPEYGGDSRFYVYEGYKDKTDVIIILMPSLAETFPAEEGLEHLRPYDTLASKSIELQDETFLRNNPVWILDVPAEKIDESYVLHFGDYDLKGTEILPSLKSGD